MAALIISILNSFVPYICYGITALESHTEEGSKSTSRYVKITLFLFINSAIVTSVITPFTDSLSNDPGGITHSIYAIFVFELISGPLFQLLDPSGIINRHIKNSSHRNTAFLVTFHISQGSQEDNPLTQATLKSLFKSSLSQPHRPQFDVLDVTLAAPPS